jgi:FkbM family methyltransferase
MLHRLLRHRWADFESSVSFYRDLVPAGALCFDVGANVGVKSEALLKAGARVVSFEPHPDLWAELRARCQSTHWALIPAALGAEPGLQMFHLSLHSGNSSLDSAWNPNFAVGATVVPVITLDLAIAQFGVPYYCKIDVEGWEAPVLAGLSTRVPLLSFEYHHSRAERLAVCLERLVALGFRQANVAGPEEIGLRWQTWRPIDHLGELPGHYGDLFVR